MSMSNRCYLCVVCGDIRRAPLPPGLFHAISDIERERRLRLIGGDKVPEGGVRPLSYGHWRNWVVPQAYEFPKWLHHCAKPMFLLGKRAAQAATQIDAAERLTWIALGARVTEHRGKKRWRPILREIDLCNAYPLI